MHTFQKLQPPPTPAKPLRPFLIIAGIAFAAGVGLQAVHVIRREPVDDLQAGPVMVDGDVRRFAERDLEALGYQVAALDPKPQVDCGVAARAFQFTAVRDHHLYDGIVRASSLAGERAQVAVAYRLR